MTVGSEVPQADRLDFIRRFVEAVGSGATSVASAAATSRLAPRYGNYAALAAKQLGLIETSANGALVVSALGSRLLATAENSVDERNVLTGAFHGSAALSELAAVVLATSAPSRTLVAELIEARWGLAQSTALRRATTLLAWRDYLLQEGEQLRFAGEEWEDGETDATTDESPSSPALLVETSDQRAVAASATSTNPSEDATPQAAEALQAALESLASRSEGPVDPADTTVVPDAVVPPAVDEAPVRIDAPPPLFPPTGDPVASAPPSGRVLGAVTPAPGAASTTPREILSDNDRAYLARHLGLGNVVLFTGAGFSLGARDIRGRPLPSGAVVAQELWPLAYPDDPLDNSSLQDIFEGLQRSNPKKLAAYLKDRFSIDGGTLPSWYQTWFAVPWLKHYTLNVDNLEIAAGLRFDLSRSTASTCALEGRATDAVDPSRQLDTIHLNGIASAGPENVTFSGEQYATRLGRQEPYYGFLAAEMLTRPFVFVGSPLEEPLFWHHLAIRSLRSQSTNELRPKSFLLSPTLSRARIDKLRAYNIVHVPATAEEFARVVLELEPVKGASEEGLRRLGATAISSTDDERNIVDVATVVTAAHTKTGFLVGEEPVWSDIRHGRAVDRDEDSALFLKLEAFAKAKDGTSRVIVVNATAGAGKSTLLMKSALFLYSHAARVAWVGQDAEVSPKTLGRISRGDKYDAIIIDDAGRYGAHLSAVLRELRQSDSLRLIVLGLRSFHHPVVQDSAPDLVHTVGPLTDADIDRLLGVLERERLLGALRHKSPSERRAAFKKQASRQLLVAMLETTSGERFEDKVVNEWAGQRAEGKFIYAVAALSTWLGYALTREEILLASRGGQRELEALRELETSRLLLSENGKLRARHRVIAETLIKELTSRGSQIDHLIVGLARALARPGEGAAPKGSRRQRVLIRLLSHDWLLRVLDGIEPARAVYASLEDYLDRDYHFWLQRGCLELEAGDTKFAQNYIHQAAGINSSDPLVETAKAHMELRTAIINPAAPGASDSANHAFDTLRRLVTARPADHYVAHVFGSQVLGWCRHASLVSRARLALLREAKDVVAAALMTAKRREELKQLLLDLKKEELTPRP